MPDFLKEREVLASFVSIVIGLILLVIGLIAADSEVRALGVALIVGAVATLGLTRGLAKIGGSGGP